VNPFDLRGPEFLLFYFIFSAIVFLILFYLRQRDERRDAGKPSLDDPYLIACLRGGEDEALRVATLSLIDRGLLTFKSSGTSVLFPGAAENRLEVKDPIAIDSVKRPIEKSILEAFKTAKPVSSTLDSLTGSTDYACRLEGYGLLPGADIRSARRRRFMFALYVLLGVAGLKIVIALSRGRTNILFLILLAGLAAYVTSRTSNPFRTARGEEFLEDVKSLFSSLRLRAASLRPGGATSDLVWLASAYGLREVPPILFPQVTALYRRKAARGSGGWDFTDWSSGDSSCGTTTSCSSSGDSGSGGGSSCGGGGGCGGGGCGGCGS
jgi:uncharacterized protein (TIGR04222 family)